MSTSSVSLNALPPNTLPVRVLFVCLGNICRSPTAHALFQASINTQGLQEFIIVDSAGTGNWHAGNAPDQRAQKVALQHGYDMSHLQARAVCCEDFTKFDYILAMDQQNLIDLKNMLHGTDKANEYHGVLSLFTTAAGVGGDSSLQEIESVEIPDPYYGDEEHFQQEIALIQRSVDGLMARIKREQSL